MANNLNKYTLVWRDDPTAPQEEVIHLFDDVGTQGAAFGGTNALRTVTAFYPVEGEQGTGNGEPVGSSVPFDRSGRIASIRHEDGKLDLYDYALVSNIWIETVTHLHEQSPEPVSGKTTRDTTETNARGETIETRTEAYIEGVWHVIARECMTYNAEGKRIATENLAGQVTTTAWDCCHKVSETQPDGSTTTWDYDADDRMIAASRLIPLDMTNVTWLTTCYEYDPLDRLTATWQTNFAAQVGLPVERTMYDPLDRVTNRIDRLGNNTATSYSSDGRTVSVLNPNTSTRIITRSADGDILSITGSAVTPEFHTYGILPDGTRWSKTVQGETASSPRFTKRYENILSQTVREERSGFQGAVLATVHSYDTYGRLISTSADYEPTTEYTYDTLGNRVAVTKLVGLAVPSEPQSETNEWRKTESFSSFVIDDFVIWLTQTNIVSCSDTNIAPLVTSSSRQLTGLTVALPARSRSTDIRGNVTESETLVDSVIVTSRQTLPYATNKPLSISRYGVSLMDVSVSAVTNTVAYDSLGRQIAQTDGRGNITRVEYNAIGQHVASIDALGNRTTYAYDQFGNLAVVTNALGNAVVYEYDLRGNKTYEGGATYPVRHTYDIFGNKTTMVTYRDESKGHSSGDVTTWLYDEASGVMTNKVYADGKGPKYDYTPDGKLSQRIWARGIATDYTYDGWGNLTNTVYADDTPTVSLKYDVLGRQIEAHDAAGVTAFLYDSYGSLTNETVVCAAGTNTIIRYWDDYGRTMGYALNGTRQTSIGYEPDKGRISTMGIENLHSTTTTNHYNSFSWTYLPGSDLKSSLVYPNGLTASWQYDANSQLLQVCNATPTNVISQYDYTYDPAGRRVAIGRSGSAMSETRTDEYGYNIRGELISAAKNAEDAKVIEYQYAYDDIGNRISSYDIGTNRTYTANTLNQYTSISNSALSASPREEFIPQFDADGNQTLIQTATGIWQVQYNGENRSVFWTNGATNIVMQFDRMGRRVKYLEVCGFTINVNNTFTYDNYLLVARNRDNLDGAFSPDRFVWDPTETVATRPLVWFRGTSSAYYTFDGNKNVSEVIVDGTFASHYEYAPFGASTVTNSTNMTTCESIEYNPFRFSAEIYDKALDLVQYNYRQYESLYGRWQSRDIIEIELHSQHNSQATSLYGFVQNNPAIFQDYLGLVKIEHKYPGALAPGASNCLGGAMTGQGNQYRYPNNNSLRKTSFINAMRLEGWICNEVKSMDGCKNIECYDKILITLYLNNDENNIGKNPWTDSSFNWDYQGTQIDPNGRKKTDLHAIRYDSEKGCYKQIPHASYGAQCFDNNINKDLFKDVPLLCCYKKKKNGDAK